MVDQAFSIHIPYITLEKDNQDILEGLTVPENLCVMSKSEMNELRHLAHQTTSERDSYLRRLEKELETVEVERSTKLNGIMTDYGLQIRKLRFLPSETAMRLLQVIN